MHRALELAALADGQTHPNPMVGAVVVRRGKIVGEGYHRFAGTPHAEIHALRAAGAKARGATLFVTLEPCCHVGRTPPCTAAIIAAGVARVVYAMRDPNPVVAGRGLRALRSAGVIVDGPCCERDSRLLNRAYGHWRATGRPWVMAKVALSLDGKIADAHGASQWITNAQARAYTHGWRARVDAMLVGRGTLVADDPQLTVRLPKYRGPQPQPILWIGGDAVPWRSKILRDTQRSALCVFAAKRPRDAARLATRGHRVIVARTPQQLLRTLGQLGIASVMIEGGGFTLGAFLRARAIDYLIVAQAPLLLGHAGRDLAVNAVWPLRNAPKILVEKNLRLGDNVIWEGCMEF